MLNSPATLNTALFCLSLLLSTQVALAKSAVESTTCAVIAVQNIKDGDTIAKNQIAVVKLPLSRIPLGVTTLQERSRLIDVLAKRPVSFYLTRIEDAAGRISLGVRKGEILYFSYPGLRDDNVVMALKNLPSGSVIRSDSVKERKLNPNTIPVFSIASIQEAIGKRSSGIRSGEVLVSNRDSKGQQIIESVIPGAHANRYKQIITIAKRKIAKGELLTDNNVEQDVLWNVGKSGFNLEGFIDHPEGQRAAHEIGKGQIITTKNVFAR